MFPLTIHDQTFEDPPRFAEAVLRDAQAMGGRVVPGESPSEWLPPLVTSGTLDRSTVVGLTAGLMRLADAAALNEGIRIAVALELDELCPVFSAALTAVDMNLLLQPAPHAPDQSIEDCLLAALVQLMDGENDAMRTTVLTHLRNAGLHEQELTLLLNHGDPEDIADGLPAIFAETLPAPNRLLHALRREQGVVDATLAALEPTRAEYRNAVFRMIEDALPELAKTKPVKNALVS